MKYFLSLLSVVVLWANAKAQVGPNITSWIQNPNHTTGYGGIESNIQTVQYSNDSIYVSCTCIPSYTIGAWPGNPNVAAAQNFVYKIIRYPVVQTSTRTAVGLGHIGVWTNGVSIFNADDGMTYNNLGVWHRNAYFWEGSGFDACLGHPQQQGEYHHHVSPKCLYDVTASTVHSPIIGWSLDGYPVYGAYAYANTNGTGGITRMRSSWQLRTMTDRTTLPGGATASSAGPAINSTYPLGAYIQDYEFVQGSGDLDSSNGRLCITPEFPSGTYAYFVTIDASKTPVYPYTLGTTYHGVVPPGNSGPGGGHNTITESTTVYSPTSVGSIDNKIKYQFVPNPVTDFGYIYFDAKSSNNIKGKIVNSEGRVVKEIENLQPSIGYAIDFRELPSGIYMLYLDNDKDHVVEKVVVVR